MSTAANRYRARFRKVLEYVDAHLDEALTVERLSGIAAFSKFHFHRQFAARFGVGVYRTIQLRRLKRAAFQLAFRDRSPIGDIASACGYEEPESFARAFGKCFGQSPSEFRKQPAWLPWRETFRSLNELRAHHMPSARQPGQVRIVEVDDIKVAVFEHRGDPRLIGDSDREIGGRYGHFFDSRVRWKRGSGRRAPPVRAR